MPAGTPPFICTYNGSSVSIDSAKQAAYNARRAAQAAAAGQVVYLATLAAGVVVTCTGNSALSGTYTVPVPNGPAPNMAAQANIVSVAAALAGNKGLPGGGSTFNYYDASGTPHAFDATHWGEFETEMMNYSYNLQGWALGGFSGDPPSNKVSIP